MKTLNNRTIHITDYLELKLKEFKHEKKVEPRLLFMTPEDIADLKEYLGLDFLDELKVYHSCKITVNDKIVETHYGK